MSLRNTLQGNEGFFFIGEITDYIARRQAEDGVDGCDADLSFAEGGGRRTPLPPGTPSHAGAQALAATPHVSAGLMRSTRASIPPRWTSVVACSMIVATGLPNAGSYSSRIVSMRTHPPGCAANLEHSPATVPMASTPTQ